jgi:hypothetical protein
MFEWLKHLLMDLIYGKEYFVLKAGNGVIYCFSYANHRVERCIMRGMAINVDIGGEYGELMADVSIKVTGVK